MISKFARIAAVVFGLSLLAVAQADPVRRRSSPQRSLCCRRRPPKPMGTKVGTINIEQAIFASNEGQRDFQELSKKFEPKQNELKGKAEEIDSLKKQLSAQQDKLNDEARDKLVKQIEGKQKSFDRSTQDAQEDFQNQQGEIGNKILTKMAPLIVKYAGRQRLRHDPRHFPAVAARPGDLVRSRRRHHAARGRSLQHAVGRGSSGGWHYTGKTREAGYRHRHQGARSQGACVDAAQAVATPRESFWFPLASYI